MRFANFSKLNLRKKIFNVVTCKRTQWLVTREWVLVWFIKNTSIEQQT